MSASSVNYSPPQAATQPQASQLTGTDVFDFALQQILKAYLDVQLQPKLELIEPPQDSKDNKDSNNKVYGVRVTVPDLGGTLILMSPACDQADKLSSSPRAAGTFILANVLQKIKQLQAKDDPKLINLYAVPLAQLGVEGFLERDHWTTLLILMQGSYFIDVKGGSWDSLSGAFTKGVSKTSISILSHTSSILKNLGFPSLLKSHLPWQGSDDYDNCGRYNPWLVGSIQRELFSKMPDNLASLQQRIEKIKAPDLKSLIKASQGVIADRRLVANRAIIAARGWVYLETQQTPESILENVRREYKNDTLKKLIENNFSELVTKHDGKPKSFENTYLNGVGLQGSFSQAEIQNKLQLAENKAERADILMAAYGSGLVTFIPGLLTDACDGARFRAQVYRVDMNEKQGDKFELVCQYNQLRIYSSDNKVMGRVKGRIDVIYHLEKMNDQWRRRVVSISTNNQDVLRVLTGMSLPLDYLKISYSKPSNPNPKSSPQQFSPPDDDYYTPRKKIEEGKGKKEDKEEFEILPSPSPAVSERVETARSVLYAAAQPNVNQSQAALNQEQSKIHSSTSMDALKKKLTEAERNNSRLNMARSDLEEKLKQAQKRVGKLQLEFKEMREKYQTQVNDNATVNQVLEQKTRTIKQYEKISKERELAIQRLKEEANKTQKQKGSQVETNLLMAEQLEQKENELRQLEEQWQAVQQLSKASDSQQPNIVVREAKEKEATDDQISCLIAEQDEIKDENRRLREKLAAAQHSSKKETLRRQRFLAGSLIVMGLIPLICVAVSLGVAHFWGVALLAKAMINMFIAFGLVTLTLGGIVAGVAYQNAREELTSNPKDPSQGPNLGPSLVKETPAVKARQRPKPSDPVSIATVSMWSAPTSRSVSVALKPPQEENQVPLPRL